MVVSVVFQAVLWDQSSNHSHQIKSDQISPIFLSDRVHEDRYLVHLYLADAFYPKAIQKLSASDVLPSLKLKEYSDDTFNNVHFHFVISFGISKKKGDLAVYAKIVLLVTDTSI